MNALVKKEIRLLLPSFGLALALALSIWLIPTESNQSLEWLVVPPLLLCPAMVVLMALDSFGREIGANTFAQLLAQPVSRARLWRTKTSLLALALLLVFGAWWLSVLWHAPAQLSANAENMPAAFTTTVLLVLTAYSGGLWSVMLLRQVGAAFWFTLIIPAALAMLTIFTTEKLDQIVQTQRNLVLVLGTYSVAGFFWARRLFLTAQDPGWTGGTLTLPTLNQWFSRTQTPGAARSHPLVALFRKEMQFQQISVVLAALLFVAHLVVLGCQSFMTVERDSLWKPLFDGFWVLWFILPLMIGCSAVAEERRLCTLEPQLCLPVSRGKQFFVKLASVMLCALVLGALPVFLTHFIGVGLGLATSGLLADLGARFALPIASGFVALVAFYASTVCRHFLQAIATTIGFGVMLAFLGNWLNQPARLFDYVLWEGPLGVLIGGAMAGLLAFGLLSGRGRWRLVFGALASLAFLFLLGLLWSGSFPNQMPVINLADFVMAFGPVALVSVLAYQNFSQVHSDGAMWRKNFGVWLTGVLLTTTIATATFHRFWEFGARFEPAAGPARLSGKVRPMIAEYFRSGWLLALLPDGRLMALREYETYPASGEWTGKENLWSVNPIKDPRPEVVGSNWLHLALSLFDGAGVRSDGTLWRVCWWESVGPDGDAVPAGAGQWDQKGRRLQQTPMRLSQIGTDTNWTMVTAGNAHFVALKQDGTIWGWGNNHLALGLPEQESITQPVQIGAESDWEFVSAFSQGSVGVKRDLTAWKWGHAQPITSRGIGKGFIGANPQKTASLPARAIQIISSHVSDVFICADGTAWGLGQLGENFMGAPFRFEMATELTKLWADGEWTEINFVWPMYAVAVKSDGSLWRQGDAQNYLRRTRPPPEQIGTRSDWIVATPYGDAVYALAKDGTLCRFGEESVRHFGREGKALLAPTRRVTWSMNLLDAAK